VAGQHGTIDAKVVSPDRALFEGEVVACFARSTEGEIGILPGHQPALLLLVPAPLELELPGGGRETFAVRSGFLEYAGGQLTILADDAEQVTDREAAFALVGEKYRTPPSEIKPDAPAIA
jgi:F-type H+-transporting ATPase subunit epsilon